MNALRAERRAKDERASSVSTGFHVERDFAHRWTAAHLSSSGRSPGAALGAARRGGVRPDVRPVAEPTEATSIGVRTYDDRVPDAGDAGLAREVARLEALLGRGRRAGRLGRRHPADPPRPDRALVRVALALFRDHRFASTDSSRSGMTSQPDARVATSRWDP
ncbi:hypothetical protein WMF04_29040 [Sorangium sp. So ce260]|uniref:hypothetical protein n=1 Tax=Sorangium sp. So ce260 TaxID=3133291 RepID=UPI003F603DE2